VSIIKYTRKQVIIHIFEPELGLALSFDGAKHIFIQGTAFSDGKKAASEQAMKRTTGNH